MEPEMGQMLFGRPTGSFACDELGDACVRHVLAEIKRVFWNTHQREWDGYTDPGVPGLEFRPYNWDEDSPEGEKPNLCLTGDPVEIRWYKYPGRGQSVTVEMSPTDWYDWLNRTLAVVRAADVKF